MATRKVIKFRGENDRPDAVFFCDIVLDGLKVTAQFGNTNHATKATHIHDRIGERFALAEDALKRFEGLIASRAQVFKKKDRTEVELPGLVEHVAPSASNPALEAEVLAQRDPGAAKGAATVYSDWLQTQGDVRGELASLFLAGQEDDARQWIADNPARVFGTLDVKLDNELYDLVWDHGFLRGASLKRASIDSSTKLAELTRTFLALPIARLVTELRFGLAGYESDNDWGPTLAAVAESAQAKQLRVLRFDDYTYEDCEISWTAFGDFSPYWSQLPALEELVIRSGEGGTLGDLVLPELKKLVRISGGLAADEITALVQAKSPKLEHLEIWFGDPNYGAQGNVAHLARIFEGTFKSLEYLGIVNCEFVGDVIEPLAKAPITKQLRTLDLRKGTLVDTEAELLIRHADAFAHLKVLDLRENQLVETAALHDRLPMARLDDQRDNDRRYVALGE